jgi:hypothetical protein
MPTPRTPTAAELKDVKSYTVATNALMTVLHLNRHDRIVLAALLTQEERFAVPEIAAQLKFHIDGWKMMPIITDRAELRKYLVSKVNLRRHDDEEKPKTPVEIIVAQDAEDKAQALRERFITEYLLDGLLAIPKFDFASLPTPSYLAKRCEPHIYGPTNVDTKVRRNIPAPENNMPKIRWSGLIVYVAMMVALATSEDPNAMPVLNKMTDYLGKTFEIPEPSASPLVITRDLTIREVGVIAGILEKHLRMESAPIRELLCSLETPEEIISLRSATKEMVDKNVVAEITKQIALLERGFRLMPFIKDPKVLHQYFLDHIELPADLSELAEKIANTIIAETVHEEYIANLYKTQPVVATTGSNYIPKACRRGTIRNNEVTLKDVARAEFALMNSLLLSYAEADKIIYSLQSAKEIRTISDIVTNLKFSALAMGASATASLAFNDEQELREQLVDAISLRRGAKTENARAKSLLFRQQFITDRFMNILSQVPKTHARPSVGGGLEYIAADYNAQIHRAEKDFVDLANGKQLDRRPFLVRMANHAYNHMNKETLIKATQCVVNSATMLTSQVSRLGNLGLFKIPSQTLAPLVNVVTKQRSGRELN